MAKQTINIGTGPNTNTGDPLRTAFIKSNANFTELYDEVAVLKTVGDPQYGSFYDTSDQYATADTATSVIFSTTYLSNAVSVAAGTQLSFLNTGVYELSYYLQFYNQGLVDRVVSMWIKRNGTNEPNTNIDITVHPGTYEIATVNHLFQITGGSYVEIMWSTPHADAFLSHTPQRTSPVRPGSPSASVNIRRAQVVF